MKTNKVLARIPLNYRDMLGPEASLNDFEAFDEIIAECLPDDVYWCGDDLIGPIDFDGDLDISEILSNAAERFFGALS